MATPHIAVTRLSESGSFDTEVRDTLIVGPGMGTSVHGLFGDMAQQLKHRFQVIGFDLPGHRESAPHHQPIAIADLADAIAQLTTNLRHTGTIKQESKVYFAGLSVSGQIAIQLGLEYAELFDGIAVMASAPKIGAPQDWEQRAQQVRAQGTESMVESSASLWVAEGFTDTTKLDIQKQALATADDETYAALCQAIGNFDATERLQEISIPVFTVAGTQDQMCTVADAEFIAKTVQQGSTAVIDGAAHLLPLEASEQLARLLDEHLG